MDIQTITDRSALETYYHQDLPLHLYSLGDLDDFYWPKTTVYGTRDKNGLQNITPLYWDEELPVLLGFGQVDPNYLNDLQHQLPDIFYAHFSPGLIDHFYHRYLVKEFGAHYKMVLPAFDKIEEFKTDTIVQVTPADLPGIDQLYSAAYPDTAFNPRTLLTGQYFGYFHKGKLISIAGIHVYSARYRVAALGNIATHPDFRGEGYGKTVTARLCQELRAKVDTIGLNVKCDNKPAISLYQSLGFRICAEYGEFSLQKRP